MKNFIVLTMIAFMMLLSACSASALENVGKELEDTIENAASTDNRYVQMVKGGYRESNPSLTYEKAFSSFFGSPRWKYFESEESEDIVEFAGDCTYQDTAVKARIQFVVDEENGTFEAKYLAFNEIPQNNLTLNAFIAKVFETSENTLVTITDSDNPSSNKGPSTADEAEKVINEWMMNNPIDLEAGLVLADTDAVDDEGAECFEFYLYLMQEDESVVPYSVYVRKADGQLMIDYGVLKTLDQWYEEDYLKGGQDYEYGNGSENKDGNNIEYSENVLDSDLIGRWRSYDGKALTLGDGGTVSEVFSFWNSLNSEPDSVTWEAANGRLTLTAHRNYQYYWAIGEGSVYIDGVEVETDELSLDKYEIPNASASGDYYRVKTSSTDLTGTWDAGQNTLSGAYVFYADGTGMIGNNPLTWYADDTTLNCQVDEKKSYDYTVYGDVLTIYFSNGSEIYTKVGN